MALPLHISKLLQDIAFVQTSGKVERSWLNIIRPELQKQPAKFMYQQSRNRIEIYHWHMV